MENTKENNTRMVNNFFIVSDSVTRSLGFVNLALRLRSAPGPLSGNPKHAGRQFQIVDEVLILGITFKKNDRK